MSDFNQIPSNSQPKSMFDTDNNIQPPKPDNHLVFSIITTILGMCSCIGLALGIIAIVFATQVDSKYNNGDYFGAQNSSKNAKIFSIIGLVIDILGIIISILYIIFLVYLQSGGYNNLLNY